MKYIFFDIESADGYMSIVEFGYVVTDTNFKILEKNEFLMNPEYKYNYGVKLHHSRRTYNSSPNFVRYYEKIKKLLTQKDILIFGYSVGNDIRYISNNCKRYNLKYFDYTAIDVQRIFDKTIKSKNLFTSLIDASEIIVPNEETKNLINHGALDDAIKTMLVLKYMTLNNKINKTDLLNNEIYQINSIKYFEQLLKNKQIKLEREKNRRDCSTIWRNFYSKYINKLNASKGKLICISSSIKYNKISLSKAINYIEIKKYCPIKDLINADYLIVDSYKDRDSILNSLNTNKKFKFILRDTINK